MLADLRKRKLDDLPELPLSFYIKIYVELSYPFQASTVDVCAAFNFQGGEDRLHKISAIMEVLRTMRKLSK